MMSNTKTTLSIGTAPLSLQAFKAKIKLDRQPAGHIGNTKSVVPIDTSLRVEPKPPAVPHVILPNPPHSQPGEIVDVEVDNSLNPTTTCGLDHMHVRPSCVAADPTDHNKLDLIMAAGRVEYGDIQIRHGLTLLAERNVPRPPRLSAPFVMIPGEIYSGENSWGTRSERCTALNRWVRQIAGEVAKRIDNQLSSDDVIAFVERSRLSIANAFERRIVRKDVVATMVKLYLASKVSTIE